MAVLVLPIPGIPAIAPGDDLARVLASAISEAKVGVKSEDVLVVCQKIVSKAEGRVVELRSVEPSDLAQSWAREHDKDPRVIELVLRESKRIVRMDGGNLIVETREGWVCANAGLDQSNAVSEGTVTLLPLDSDGSAARLRRSLRGHLGVDLGIIVTDTFGRPWRQGQVEFAIGVAGLDALADLRGTRDLNGHELHVTTIAVADELACAAGLVMGKADGMPAVLIRGYRPPAGAQSAEAVSSSGARSLVRPRESDLFR